MAAAILTPGTITLHNIPYVRDIITQRRLLEDIGAHVLTLVHCSLDLARHGFHFRAAAPSARVRLIYTLRVLRDLARKSFSKPATS